MICMGCRWGRHNWTQLLVRYILDTFRQFELSYQVHVLNKFINMGRVSLTNYNLRRKGGLKTNKGQIVSWRGASANVHFKYRNFENRGNKISINFQPILIYDRLIIRMWHRPSGLAGRIQCPDVSHLFGRVWYLIQLNELFIIGHFLIWSFFETSGA